MELYPQQQLLVTIQLPSGFTGGADTSPKPRVHPMHS